MDLDPLTLREIDVLKLVTAGLTTREVADRLHRSPRTIDAHLRSIRQAGRHVSQRSHPLCR